MKRNIDKNFYDNFSKVLGSHTIRAGVTAQWMTKTENGPTGTNGSFTFQTTTAPGAKTSIPGSAFANFLLGNAASFSQSSRDIIPHLNYSNIEAYVQDDWKVSSRLTLNMGIRYSFFPAPSDSNNLLNNFDPALYNPAHAPLINPSNGNFVAGQGVLPSTYVNGIIFPQGPACSAAQAFAPVTCSPYGSSVNPNSNNNWGPRFRFRIRCTRQRQNRRARRLRCLLRPHSEWPLGTERFYGAAHSSLHHHHEHQLRQSDRRYHYRAARSRQLRHLRHAHLQSPLLSGTTTFRIEQQIFGSSVFQIAYVGTKGTHLLGEIDANQPTLAARQANPTVNVNAIRPYLGYSYFKTRTTDFNSNYNSLQVSLNRRVAHGLNLGVSYTWSKNLTDNPADRDAPLPNTYNYAYSYGPASLNTPHVLHRQLRVRSALLERSARNRRSRARRLGAVRHYHRRIRSVPYRTPGSRSF